MWGWVWIQLGMKGGNGLNWAALKCNVVSCPETSQPLRVDAIIILNLRPHFQVTPFSLIQPGITSHFQFCSSFFCLVCDYEEDPFIVFLSFCTLKPRHSTLGSLVNSRGVAKLVCAMATGLHGCIFFYRPKLTAVYTVLGSNGGGKSYKEKEEKPAWNLRGAI